MRNIFQISWINISISGPGLEKVFSLGTLQPCPQGEKPDKFQYPLLSIYARRYRTPIALRHPKILAISACSGPEPWGTAGILESLAVLE